MSDFTSEFWNWYIIVPSVLGILACALLVIWMSSSDKGPTEDNTTQTMGHVWDGDLEEYNNPLPAWWRNMFYISIFFAVVYLIWYPGLGTFAGVGGWTSVSQYEEEVLQANDKYAPLYAQYAGKDITELAKDKDAVHMGKRLYLTYCTACHGSDASGITGFPDLTDKDWLWGGAPAQIKQTIMDGRKGTMPAWEGPLGGEAGVQDMTQYVLSLSQRSGVDTAAAERGKVKFGLFCAGCHLPTGTGLQALGAPNLTDNVWLYGGHPKTIAQSIAKGRHGNMPSHGQFLGDDKAHLLATYIYSLSMDK